MKWMSCLYYRPCWVGTCLCGEASHEKVRRQRDLQLVMSPLREWISTSLELKISLETDRWFLGGWVSSQLWLVSNKIVWLFGFLCLEFGGWVVWQGWTKRANNNILRWSKLPWMQLLFRLDDSYGLWDILPLIIFLKLRSHWQHTLRFSIFWEIWGST